METAARFGWRHLGLREREFLIGKSREDFTGESISHIQECGFYLDTGDRRSIILGRCKGTEVQKFDSTGCVPKPIPAPSSGLANMESEVGPDL